LPDEGQDRSIGEPALGPAKLSAPVPLADAARIAAAQKDLLWGNQWHRSGKEMALRRLHSPICGIHFSAVLHTYRVLPLDSA